MILRPLSPSPRSSRMEPIWAALERSQHQDFSAGCWLIPQPAHAALAGDVAAHLAPKTFPGITPEVVRAIALHDAGWSLDDAAVIQESRAKGAKAKPYSFIAAAPRDTVAAWTGSVEIAGKSSPLGAFLVSRHFAAIAEAYRGKADAPTAKVLDAFLAQESSRRQRLRRKIACTDAELDRILEALQFADLLSLYLACGLSGDVEFPQNVRGEAIRLTRHADSIQLAPNPFTGEYTLEIAALRHPRTEDPATQTFALTIAL